MAATKIGGSLSGRRDVADEELSGHGQEATALLDFNNRSLPTRGNRAPSRDSFTTIDLSDVGNFERASTI
ncbi:MAG: hypothetical protein MMC33_007878 [Icmadophila ericetorum]|nr:hypothetical protein [Icmadophila ericetorum]